MVKFGVQDKLDVGMSTAVV